MIKYFIVIKNQNHYLTANQKISFKEIYNFKRLLSTIPSLHSFQTISQQSSLMFNNNITEIYSKVTPEKTLSKNLLDNDNNNKLTYQRHYPASNE